ncbi:MAG TPA: plasmid pRiA4b ORF-3 family protein [Baekduia sp.]|uniref:plasmid pRiA4b ORF-3 family protein n=1 Tax=Baekduia sp. TaxID=2600305 RepID=UPI002B77A483|nr:plasmid pRiA4b ORF-3 family protein [Baekduia sp.]HMJ32414.1 plasmid pRiA4b ORF-3 family protein [Baekduia sp.]
MAERDRDAVMQATAPARWLLEAGVEGVPLTATQALARAVVRDAALRWPIWWDAELFGPPYREAELAPLTELHDGLRRLKLVRRRGGRLYATPLGRDLLARPEALLDLLASDLGAGDAYTDMVARVIVATLARGSTDRHADLVAPALRETRRGGWRGPDYEVPDERHVSSTVSDVLIRGEGYGLIDRQDGASDPRRRREHIALSMAARLVLGLGPTPVRSRPMAVLVFDAELTNVRGVRARLAVRADQPLTMLHDAIQEAFGWDDDHLYSFWLDGRFWGDRVQEYTSPVVPDDAPQTADVPLAELDLATGQKIAYVFDFGDEWRVRLTLREQTEPDDGAYPRVLERKGTAPPQYPDYDDEELVE